MRYRYHLCDVFTDTRFGGNQLAVLPEASGLSDQQMQQIAREFNFSESSFVFPAQNASRRKVRIFTPTAEVPFAGHPNIGTAFVLAATGELGQVNTSTTVMFEERAGVVPVSIHRRAEMIWCELAAPETLSVGATTSTHVLASAVSLKSDDIVTATHAPRTASVGLPFLFAELRDRATLERAQPVTEKFDALVAAGAVPDVHLYVHSADDFDIRARMFAPLAGITEDPATGSANCALAGLLGHCSEQVNGGFHWRIAQGMEIGRPSVLEARAEKRAGAMVATWIGGYSVLVGEGCIEVD
ncbi:MAG: PhzF family phenazine biosynthesis protein [Rhodanobacteraceae bacterium]